jgi:hypothetical protein
MVRGRVPALAWALAAAVLTGACASETPQQIRDAFPDVLIPAAARNVQRQERNGVRQVEFELEELFPASRFICATLSHLDRRRWRALPRSFLNPDVESDLAKGWGSGHSAPPNGPATPIVMWQADWINGDGTLLTYVLAYRSPEAEEDLRGLLKKPLPRALQVGVSLWPPAAVKALNAAPLQEQSVPAGWMATSGCEPSKWSPLVTRQGDLPPAPAPLDLARVRTIALGAGVDVFGNRLVEALERIPDLHIRSFADLGKPQDEVTATLDYQVDRRSRLSGLPDQFFVKEVVIWAPYRPLSPPGVMFHWIDGGDRADFGFVEPLASSIAAIRAK